MTRLSGALLGLIRRDALIIVPNTQRAVAVQLAYATVQLAEGRISWRSPRIITWRSWLESRLRQSGTLHLLPEIEEWLTWRDAAQHSWLRQPGQSDSPSDALIETLRRSAVLLFEYGLPERLLLGTPEAEWLGRTIEACDAACAATGAVPRYRLPALPGPRAGARAQEPPFLCGFSDFTAFQKTLLEAGELRELEADRQPIASGTVAEGFVRGIVAETPADELALAAEWARERLQADPAARLLVVIQGLRQNASAIERRFEQTLLPQTFVSDRARAIAVVALEGGRDLDRFPLVAQRLAAMTPPRGLHPAPELLEWMRTVAGGFGPQAAAARLAAWLVSVLEPECDTDALVRVLRNAPAPVAALAAETVQRLELIRALPWGRADTFAAWGGRFRDLWRGIIRREQANSAEQQTSNRAESLLDELARSVAPSRLVDGWTAAALVRTTAARTRFEPASGDAAVTLTGALTDPILEYDGIWVSGLDANAWPPPARPDPFIPATVQRSAGMTHASASRLAADARRRMHRWLKGSRELVLSWSRLDDGTERRPSALVMEFLHGEPFATPSRAAPLARALHQPRLLERFEDVAGLPWTDTRGIPHGSRALELQALCAFRAYAELRLQATAAQARAPGIDPRERGKLLHAALEFLWTDLQSGPGLEAAAATLETHIERAIARAETELGWNDGEHAARRHRLRERRRLAELLRVLCERDLKRPAFLEVRCERQVSFEVAGSRMHLRIDRIDRLADGRVAIFDYKSGVAKRLSLTSDRLIEPQLPMYALACGELVAAVATVHLTASTVKLRGLAARDDLIGRVDVVPDWTGQIERWRTQIEALGMSFLAGHALRDPSEEACRLCHLHVVCRIAKNPEDLDRSADD